MLFRSSLFYRRITPKLLQNDIDNFLQWLETPNALANNLLQGNFNQAETTLKYFVLQSFYLGHVDLKAKYGLNFQSEDFGQTLGKWGVDQGPYIVLPFLGPTTVRDGLSRGIDSVIYPLAVANDLRNKSGLMKGINVLNQTTVLLELDNFVSGDKYIFFRDAYLQRRKYEISDGEIDADDFVDEFEDF